ncbi:Mitochondrial import inner membrane translocase subunit TIM23-1 [Platanthera guangdongensis]|uniref:Mitochondrial import inner membrane translocase subunit TIM23-1 n=1 Tax=Platanthera guangdongensis TaxID=2320717 RepID=A0ABR2LNH0_9ASPA
MSGPINFSYGGGEDSDHRQDLGRRTYDPYKDLQIPYRAIYDLPTSPEFLFQEESAVQRRSWGENLTYYTGIGYVGGSFAGASVGLYNGLRAAEPGDTLKLRLNRVLNSSGQDGRRLGNRLGIIGLLYAGMESGLVAVRDRDDWINSVVAGLGTGAFYKAANGPRSAAIAGAIGGLMVGAAVAGKQVLKRYVPI